MCQTDNRRYAKYHSPEWDTLVEQGWVTESVDGDVAAMLWCWQSARERGYTPRSWR